MNENQQAILSQDYNDGLLTEQEVHNVMDDARHTDDTPSYVERYANGAEQEAA